MPNKKSNEEIIANFKAVHGDRYDYSKTIYSNSSIKVVVLCSVHGAFEVLSSHHKNGVGCRKCYFESQKISMREFLSRSQNIWGDTYDYSFIRELPVGRKKAHIFCNVHKVFFHQEPRNHMRGHTGCTKCRSSKLTGSRETLGVFTSQSQLNEGMISRAREIHGNKYDYGDFIYVNYETKGSIICPLHGKFLQATSNHLKGRGCPKCAIDNVKSGSFKEKCKFKGVNYHRALKRKQAGLSDEKIFRDGYIRNERAINEITIGQVRYPNMTEL